VRGVPDRQGRIEQVQAEPAKPANVSKRRVAEQNYATFCRAIEGEECGEAAGSPRMHDECAPVFRRQDFPGHSRRLSVGTADRLLRSRQDRRD